MKSELSDRPVLVVDPGCHTAMITRADVDEAGVLAVTGSLDRTVRIWRLADGKLHLTIRVPVGAGSVGKVYAVAISPDGKWVAAGGYSGLTSSDIYIFDTGTGDLIKRIELPMSDVVDHLAMSPAGRRLAAMLGGKGGLRIYSRHGGWEEVARDENYGSESYGAAFAPDGRLATTSWDGQLRMYDVHGGLIRSINTGLPKPYGVAFSPEGSRLAVGFADSVAVQLRDGSTLEPLPSPDTSGIANGYLSTVAWSRGGETLFAAGEGSCPVIAWDGAGTGHQRRLPTTRSLVITLRPLPDGSLFVARADPAISVLSQDGSTRWEQAPRTFRIGGGLAVTRDATVIDFGFSKADEAGGVRFDLEALRFDSNRPLDGRTALPITD